MLSRDKALKQRRISLAAVKYIVFVFILFVSAFSLLMFPDTAGSGVVSGIEMCIKSVIPSLFPFMVVSSMLMQSEITGKISGILEPLTRAFFRLPGLCFPVIILSQIGGFPVGGSLVKQLIEKNQISKNQGQRLMLFCINPGPAFVISYLGSSLLHSKSAGALIYLSVVLSSLLIGVFSRFLCSDDENSVSVGNELKKPAKSTVLSEILIDSVKKSTISMALICSWVVVFSCLTNLTDVAFQNENTKIFFSALLEVTNGCKNVAGHFPPSIIAGVIGWSGICIHFQVMDAVIKTGLKFKYFLTARILNASLATVICEMLFKLLPSAVPAGGGFSKDIMPSSSGIPISLLLIIMCILLLSGGNIVIRDRKSCAIKSK